MGHQETWTERKTPGCLRLPSPRPHFFLLALLLTSASSSAVVGLAELPLFIPAPVPPAFPTLACPLLLLRVDSAGGPEAEVEAEVEVAERGESAAPSVRDGRRWVWIGGGTPLLVVEDTVVVDVAGSGTGIGA